MVFYDRKVVFKWFKNGFESAKFLSPFFVSFTASRLPSVASSPCLRILHTVQLWDLRRPPNNSRRDAHFWTLFGPFSRPALTAKRCFWLYRLSAPPFTVWKSSEARCEVWSGYCVSWRKSCQAFKSPQTQNVHNTANLVNKKKSERKSWKAFKKIVPD